MRHDIAIGDLFARLSVWTLESFLRRRLGGSSTLQAHDLTDDGAKCHRRSRPCLFSPDPCMCVWVDGKHERRRVVSLRPRALNPCETSRPRPSFTSTQKPYSFAWVASLQRTITRWPR